MAIFHVSTSKPTKAELIERWIPTQDWGPAAMDTAVSIGSFHFDDPEGRVGMETHLIDAGGTLFQVPLTYRDTPLEGAADSLVGTIEHSVLGTRWVYDGLRDDRYVSLLAGVALTGQGQALGMAFFDGRWYVAPTAVRLCGGGWNQEPVPVDGFVMMSSDATVAKFTNDGFDMTVHRRPQAGPQPPIGLTATTDERAEPVVLAELRKRS